MVERRGNALRAALAAPFSPTSSTLGCIAGAVIISSPGSTILSVAA
jgi:hypothetical protein